MSPRSIVYCRIAVALAQGAALYFLYHLQQSNSWPATDRLLFFPMVAVASAVPLILIAALGNLRGLTLMIWLLAATALCSALPAYHIYRLGRGLSAQWWTSTLHLGLLILSIVFIVHSLVVSADSERRPLATYARYFDVSWKHALQLGLAAIFLGVFWALLFLGAQLFRLIHIERFDYTIRQPWFSIPSSALVVAVGLHLTDVRSAIVRGTRGLMLVLFSWLLPLMMLIALAFLLALPFTGLDPLWNTRRATTILLGTAVALILLINSAYQDGRSKEFRPIVLRYSSVVAALVLPLLVFLAAYGLWLRVDQYGWTPDRVVVAAYTIIIACYGVCYPVAAMHSGTSLRELEIGNVLTALFIVMVLIALSTPIADPARISVADQVGRLQSGRVSPDKFDFHFLRFHSGRYGTAALERMADVSEGVFDARATERARAALQLPDNSQTANKIPPATQESRAANITVIFPPGATLPAGFLRQDWSSVQKKWLLPACLLSSGKCQAVLIDLDGDATPEILIFGSGQAAAFKSAANDTWDFIGTIAHTICPALRDALNAGHVNVAGARPLFNDVETNGQRLQVESQSNCVSK
jgi:Domain of unknown function (DUF4153)